MDKKNNHPLRRKVMNDSLWALFSTLTARIGGLIFTIIAARYLLPEGFGLYGLALSVAIIFITFADLGINQAMIRYVSSEIERDKKKAAAYFQYLFKIKISLSIIFSLALLLLSYFLAYFVFHKPDLFILFIILSFYILILAIEGFFESLFYVKNKVGYISIKEIIFQSLRIISAIGVFYFVARTFYVVGVTLALTINILIILFLILYFYKKEFYFLSIKNGVRIDKKRVLKFVGFATIASLSSILFSYMDAVILGIFLSVEFVGYYKAAISLIIALAGTLSFSGVFLSVLTKIKESKLQKSFDKIVRYLLVLIIPAVVGIILLAKYFIVLTYGYEYLKAATLLYYLTPLVFFMVMVSLFSNLLSAREKNKEFAYLTLGAMILNIVLNVAFIKYFLQFSELSATNGLAIAMLISWAIYFVGVVIIAKKKLGITFKTSLLVKPLVASAFMGGFLYYINRYIANMTTFIGAFEVLAGAVIYFAVLILIGGIKREDIGLLFKTFKKSG